MIPQSRTPFRALFWDELILVTNKIRDLEDIY
jgi:hypothetical protein